jgi:hypothetical protein
MGAEHRLLGEGVRHMESGQAGMPLGELSRVVRTQQRAQPRSSCCNGHKLTFRKEREGEEEE